MFNKNINCRYELFSIANLLAAFGGGMILGRGMKVIVNSFLQGGTILAFLIGTVLGLVFLFLLPRNLSKTIPKFFHFFVHWLLFFFCGFLKSIQSMKQFLGKLPYFSFVF